MLPAMMPSAVRAPAGKPERSAWVQTSNTAGPGTSERPNSVTAKAAHTASVTSALLNRHACDGRVMSHREPHPNYRIWGVTGSVTRNVTRNVTGGVTGAASRAARRFQCAIHLLRGHRQVADAHTHRVLHRIGDGRRNWNARRLADAADVVRPFALLRFQDHRGQRRHVAHSWHLVVAKRQRCEDRKSTRLN